jgi:hypothetical protein
MAVKLVTLAQTTVTTAGTRVQVSASALPITTIVVSVPAANTGSIFFGDSNVSSTRGIEIAKGSTISITADLSGRPGGDEMILSDFYVDAANNGDDANISYITRR